MEPRIETLQEKKLLGMRLSMSLSSNKTGELWRSFMMRRQEISNGIGAERYSMQVYRPGHFDQFDPSAEFVKWATVEVTDFDNLPEGMEPFLLAGGLYAVFHHRGTDVGIFRYIFTEWLPKSAYSLDDRPHFEVLGEKYRNNDPSSEEEIWIPIRPSTQAIR